MEKKIICNICHNAINTQHVFSKSNQVYLKKDTNEVCPIDNNNDEWFPINFQWIPIVELNSIINHQSNKSSK